MDAIEIFVAPFAGYVYRNFHLIFSVMCGLIVSALVELK